MRTWQNGRQHAQAHTVGKGEGRRRQRHVFVYFDNDVKVHATFDAGRLAARLGVPTGQDKQGGFALPDGWSPASL